MFKNYNGWLKVYFATVIMACSVPAFADFVTKGSHFGMHMTVYGFLDSTDSEFDSLTLFGSANFKHSIVHNALAMEGNLEASDSQFESSVDVYGNRARLTQTRLGTLTIHSYNPNATVELLSGSVVQGDVRFKGARGKLIMTGGTVTGRVIHGGDGAKKVHYGACTSDEAVSSHS